jgi:hypothetical protein
MAGFASTFDHGFISDSQVFVVGNGEAPVPDSELENCSTAAAPNPNAICTTNPAELVGNGGKMQWMTFTDPLSGKTYAAHSIPSVQLCSSVLSDFTCAPGQANNVRQDVGVRMLEHAALLNTAQSNPALSTELQQVAQTQYLQYQENLDMMRSLQAAFGYGPFETDQLKPTGKGNTARR